MLSRAIVSVFIFALSLASSRSLFAQGPNLPPGTRFIMSHFNFVQTPQRAETEKLFISVSPDGVNWTQLNNGQPVWAPPNAEPFYNVVRDPSIVHANGYFWVAYTSGNYGYHASFSVVKSTDLINWTFVKEVSTVLPTTYEPFTWGPFFFKDTDGSVHLFVSIGERKDRDTGQAIFKLRSYELHPTNADFTEWSAPVMVQAPSDFINEFWVWREGDVYHAIYVDFKQGANYIHVTSPSLISGWSNPQFIGRAPHEGAFVLKSPTNGYRVYAEGAPNYGYQYYDYSNDFTNPQSRGHVNSPMMMRNGKVISAPDATSYAQWTQTAFTSQPAGQKTAAADPDGDGLLNALECALGTSPEQPNVTPLKQVRRADGSQQLQFIADPSLSNLSLNLESASNLNWLAPVPGLSLRSRTILTDGRVLHEWNVPPPAVGSTANRFFRLKAETDAP